MIDRQIFWKPWNGLGLESLHLIQRGDQIRAQSVVIGAKDGVPFQLAYEIRCDRAWKMHFAKLELLHSDTHLIQLETDGAGNWINRVGQSIYGLQGCFEVDISATPFTNSLAIRRLALQPGESKNIRAVYIAIPAMQIRPVPQRYTCLKHDETGGLHRYDGIFREFTAELPVDEDGVVIDYPDTFRRIYPELTDQFI
ncbi:MAG: putative glycolipid-binding domain-containing protein [Elainellaceae cyanobacterium]